MTTATIPPRPQVAIPDWDAIPDELKQMRVWAIWEYTFDAKQGKWTKPPRKPVDDGRGPWAHSNRPDHRWAFEQCRRVVEAGGADGIGLFTGDGLFANDLDNVIDAAGEPLPWAYDLIHRRIRTYTEITPSGVGVRQLGICGEPLPSRDGPVNPDGSRLQFFGTEKPHFVTVTGDIALRWTPEAGRLNDVTAAVVEWHAETFPPAAQTPRAQTRTAGGRSVLSDVEIVKWLLDDAMFADEQRLWAGDLSPVNDDHSEGDYKLLRTLIGMTQGDTGQAVRLFEQSGLVREKWHERDDYRQRTIDKALDSRRGKWIDIPYWIDPAKKAEQAEIAASTAGLIDPSPSVNVSSNGAGPHTNGTDPHTAGGDPSANGSGAAANSAAGNGPSPKASAGGAPYAIRDGRMIRLWTDKDGAQQETVIADFTAVITEEITDTETGDCWYVMEGAGKRGGAFRAEISAQEFGSPTSLCKVLEARVGALDGVRAEQHKHMGAAIKTLTGGGTLVRTRRYPRTGWADGRFLIPGRVPAGVHVDLPKDLPFGFVGDADPNVGLTALGTLLETVDPAKTTVILAHVLAGPLATVGGWSNERGGLFVDGKTGRFKTSVSKLVMAIYGRGFEEDDRLIKWGEGATRNAIMALAAGAGDLPFLIDNFKSTIGDGESGFTALIHNILEGGERKRLNRDSKLRAARSVTCWPLVTGETLPRSDAAGLARVLVIEFDGARACDLDALSAVQADVMHLEAVGAAWIEWLESDAGRKAAADAMGRFQAVRKGWITELRAAAPDMANPARVASNLTVNQLTFEVALEHPLLGGLLGAYRDIHRGGLAAVGGQMAAETSEAVEAMQFLTALQDLIGAGRALVQTGARSYPQSTQELERLIGWRETDDSVYLLPLAVKVVEKFTGKKFDNTQLNRQFDELGLIQSRDSKRRTKVISVGGESVRTVHLKADAFALR